MRKLLILDCDGVLYPASNIVHTDFINALHKTEELFLQKISEEEEKNIRNGADMWNVLRSQCKKNHLSFEVLCKNIVANISYKKIRKSNVLLSLLHQCRKNFDVVILSDNHYCHIENVLRKRFGLGIKDFADLGIRCFDITDSEKDGVFWPKKAEDMLARFCEKNHRKAQDCIFVDNCMNNIEAGIKVGMQTVFISPRYTLQKYLKSIECGKKYD